MIYERVRLLTYLLTYLHTITIALCDWPEIYDFSAND